ncbi:MAG: DHH family phosphoesterase [Oscillospiraceae bacterium]|nr:DHH family phosphoesterase [Oscillospiraceae bacterium]
MKLTDLNRFKQIVIQLHDNPDADAAGSGYALYRYFNTPGRDVRLVYGGRNAVSKSNMKLMISELEIPLEHVTELSEPELLLTVDCQYGEGNVQKFAARNVAVIDHHSTGMQSGEMAEIRSHLVSCSTLCYAMLNDAGFDVNEDVRIATALYYGLYMDSNQLSEISHPLDRDMIDLLRYDKSLVTRLKYANFSMSELETAGIAISHNNYIEKYRTAIVTSEPCDPSILGVIGDFVIQVDSIDVCVIFNEQGGGYKLSVRSCSLEASANELATFLTTGIGSGGGHFTKAGGFINGRSFCESFPGKTIEQYLSEKMSEYFEGYDVVRSTDPLSQPEKLLPYRKRPGIYGYVKSTDVAGDGVDLRIRTLEGDVSITARSDIYIMIGIQGEVYPVETRVFDRKYTPLDEPFSGEFEYPPSVVDAAAGRSLGLLPMARKCRSGQQGIILARPLEKFTKVFTAWNYEAYMSGAAGDMLCYTEGDSRDVYVVKREIFDEVYAPAENV